MAKVFGKAKSAAAATRNASQVAAAQAANNELTNKWLNRLRATANNNESREQHSQLQSILDYFNKTATGAEELPAIDWANALPHRPDALIYLTDGHAAAPASRPRMPCLWIITPYGISSGQGVWSALPGRVVRIPDAALDLSPRGPS